MGPGSGQTLTFSAGLSGRQPHLSPHGPQTGLPGSGRSLLTHPGFSFARTGVAAELRGLSPVRADSAPGRPQPMRAASARGTPGRWEGGGGVLSVLCDGPSRQLPRLTAAGAAQRSTDTPRRVKACLGARTPRSQFSGNLWNVGGGEVPFGSPVSSCLLPLDSERSAACVSGFGWKVLAAGILRRLPRSSLLWGL